MLDTCCTLKLDKSLLTIYISKIDTRKAAYVFVNGFKFYLLSDLPRINVVTTVVNPTPPKNKPDKV